MNHPPSGPRPGYWRTLARAMASWRTASVSLIGFSSGLPLGILWIAIPDWMRSSGVDIRVVGLFALTQLPFTFKFLYSPLMDRFSPPWLGRRRGWMALAQFLLVILMLALAGVGHRPEAPWVVGAIAFAIALAAASQDIAYDAYTVDVLRREEQGVAVGAKNFFYMLAFRGLGGGSIYLAASWSWPVVNVVLALAFVPWILVTWKAPEPPDAHSAPRTMREAVWHPFLGFLGRHRALEILAFVFFYKFADNLAVAMTRPFLVDMGYNEFDRGLGLTLVGAAAIVLGGLIGGVLSDGIGLVRSLWLFGFLQIASNVGYVLVARSGVDRALMYSAGAFDSLAQGLGSAAFTILLLRMTQKRFSATQYALFSSLFGLPRVVAGPVCGFLVDAVGWEWFFWSTLVAGIPGMVLLHRFAPLGTREPRIGIEPTAARRPLSPAGLWGRGAAGAALGTLTAVTCVALLGALKAIRSQPGGGFDLQGQVVELFSPSGLAQWTQLAGVAVFGVFSGMLTAAVFAARHGAAHEAVE